MNGIKTNCSSNTPKGQISNRKQQENKIQETLRKRTFLTIFLICIRTCTYQGIKNIYFLESLVCWALFFLSLTFWNFPFWIYYFIQLQFRMKVPFLKPFSVRIIRNCVILLEYILYKFPGNFFNKMQQLCC